MQIGGQLEITWLIREYNIIAGYASVEEARELMVTKRQ